MRNLGVIPVRGGSKRLPRKNLMDLGGKSITHRAIDEALESGIFTDIIISTDDSEIIEHCEKYNGDIIIDDRDPALARDNSTVRQVVVELANRYTKQNNSYDTLSVMLATCPFRKSKHIKEAFELFDNSLDGVFGVTEYDFPWESSMTLDENFNTNFTINPSPLVTGNTRSQNRKKVYHPNGSIYIVKWSSLLKNENYFKGKTKAYVMDNLHSQDIDEKVDMEIAKIIIDKGLV